MFDSVVTFIPSWLYTPSAIRCLSSIISIIILVVVLFDFFSKRTPAKIVDSPASFLRLDQIASRAYIARRAAFLSLPIVTMYVLICYNCIDFLESVRQKITSEQMVASVIPLAKDVGFKFGDWISIIPHEFDPILVLVVFLLAFGTILGRLVGAFRDMFYSMLDLDGYVDDISRPKALQLLEEEESMPSVAFDRLRAFARSRLPVPEELEKSDDITVLTYQLTYVAGREKGRGSYCESLEAICSKIGLNGSRVREKTPIALDFSLPAVAFYVVLCMLYLALDPCISIGLYPQNQPASQVWVMTLFGPISWYKYDYWEGLWTTFIQASVTFILPLALGMKLHSKPRRTNLSQKGGIDLNVRIFTMVVTAALFAALVCEIVDQLRFAGGTIRSIPSAFDGRTSARIIVTAFAPALALLSWIRFGAVQRSRLAAGIVLSISGGIALAFVAAFSEMISGVWYGFYWHNLVLGAYTAGAYSIAAVAAGKVAPPNQVVDSGARGPILNAINGAFRGSGI